MRLNILNPKPQGVRRASEGSGFRVWRPHLEGLSVPKSESSIWERGLTMSRFFFHFEVAEVQGMNVFPGGLSFSSKC